MSEIDTVDVQWHRAAVSDTATYSGLKWRSVCIAWVGNREDGLDWRRYCRLITHQNYAPQPERLRWDFLVCKVVQLRIHVDILKWWDACKRQSQPALANEVDLQFSYDAFM